MKTNFFWILILTVFSLLCRSVEAKGIIFKDAPIQFYLVEILGPSQNQMNSPSSKVKDFFINQMRLAGFHVLYDMEPPFVSKAMAHYVVFQPGGFQLSGIGYVHCLLSDDGTTHYVSDSGEDVTLKDDPKSLIWLFEKKKALEMADQAGAKYAFVVEMSTQMDFQSNSPKPVYNVDLKANLYQVDNGGSVFQYDQSMVKLASTAPRAVLGAAQFLGPQLLGEMQDHPPNGGSGHLF